MSTKRQRAGCAAYLNRQETRDDDLDSVPIADDGAGETVANDLARARARARIFTPPPNRTQREAGRTCACCPRPAERRSRFCWHRDCPGTLIWCDGCEHARALPGSPVCGPCALRLARDRRALRVYEPPAGQPKTMDPLDRGALIEFRPGHGRRAAFRARVRVSQGRRRTERRVYLGVFPTEADAREAVREFNRGRRAA